MAMVGGLWRRFGVEKRRDGEEMDLGEGRGGKMEKRWIVGGGRREGIEGHLTERDGDRMKKQRKRRKRR